MTIVTRKYRAVEWPPDSGRGDYRFSVEWADVWFGRFSPGGWIHVQGFDDRREAVKHAVTCQRRQEIMDRGPKVIWP